jgi:hypothetical protein
MFENRVLRRIFGPNRNEVTGGWRKLHNEEMQDLYSSPNIIRIIKWGRKRWAEYVARMGKTRNVYMLFVGEPDGKSSLGRPRHRVVDNSKFDIIEIAWDGVVWIGLAQDSDKWMALVTAG